MACSSFPSRPTVLPALPITSWVPPYRRPAAYNFGYMSPSEPDCRNIIKRWGGSGGGGGGRKRGGRKGRGVRREEGRAQGGHAPHRPSCCEGAPPFSPGTCPLSPSPTYF